MPNWNIFRKIGAIIISGATVFILTVENMFQINTANAYNSDTIPQLKSINIDSEEPYSYIGILQKVMNIDIDDDGKKKLLHIIKTIHLNILNKLILMLFTIFMMIAVIHRKLSIQIYTHIIKHILFKIITLVKFILQK